MLELLRSAVSCLSTAQFCFGKRKTFITVFVVAEPIVIIVCFNGIPSTETTSDRYNNIVITRTVIDINQSDTLGRRVVD